MHRFQELDVLRGFASIIVLLYHFTYRYYELYNTEQSLTYPFSYGHYGVQLFFIISGFVIFMSLSKTKKSMDFILNRTIRLYPTYWISILISFSIITIFGLEGREVNLFELILNFTMIHTQFNISSVDGVYWTLLLELKFYLLMLFAYHYKWFKHLENIFIFIFIFVFSINMLNLSDFFIYKILNQLLILNYLSYFVAGIMFYKLYYNLYSKKTIIILLLSYIISVQNHYYVDIIIITTIYFIFLLVALKKLAWLNYKPLVFLGSISYPLYLIHQNIGYIVLNYSFIFKLNYLLATILAIIISIIIASIITYLFENRIITILKNYVKKHQK